MPIEAVNSFIKNLGYSFTFSPEKHPNTWNYVESGDFKGAYIYRLYTLKDTATFLCLSIYNHRTGESVTETFSSRPLTQGEQKNAEKQLEAQAQEVQKEKERQWAKTKEICWEMYSESSPDPKALDEHPYISRKLLQGLSTKGSAILGLRSRKLELTHNLYVPLQDVSGGFWGLQLIREDGKKEFLPGQRLGGVFCNLGAALSSLDDGSGSGDVVYLCEGVATACSIAAALDYKYPVLACMAANNMKKVALEVRGNYEALPIIICADNDQWKPDRGNTGRKAAEDIWNSVDGTQYVLPDFSRRDVTSHPTDFNDLHSLSDLEEVARQIVQCVPRRPQVVTPRGHVGGTYYFSTLRSATLHRVTEFTETDLLKIADFNYWSRKYPAPKVKYDHSLAKADLIAKSQLVGVFNPDRIKSVGVWHDGDNVVINAGSRLYVSKDRGVYREQQFADYKSFYFYEQGPHLTLPLFSEDPKPQFLLAHNLIQDFSFKNPSDYKLLLGWLLTAPLSGMLPWRPHIMLTAEAGSGKSTIIQKVIIPYFQHWFTVKEDDYSEASIRQGAGHGAPVVILDEFDTNKGDVRRLEKILSLIRVGSSGGEVGRGTPSGKKLKFTAKFSCLLAGISTPPLGEADQGRITKLELTKNFRRDSWESFSADLSSVFDSKLASHGFWRAVNNSINIVESSKVLFNEIERRSGGRSGQQFGVLLAGYWHWLNDSVISREDSTKLVDEFFTGEESRKASIVEEKDQCLEHLLGLAVTSGDERLTLGDLLEGSGAKASKEKALSLVGMTLLGESDSIDGIFVPTQSVELKKHFKDTPWLDWCAHLERIGGAKRTQVMRRKLGIKRRGVTVPLCVIKDKF